MIALVFDTETTGLVSNRLLRSDRQPEVIEFYGCIANLANGEITKELDCLIKPERGVSDEIEKITGISNAMLESAPAFASVAPKIKSLIEEAPLVIAHNLSFDMDMIEIEFARLGETISWPPGICTVEQTIHLKGFRLKMGDLHEMLFEERFGGAHRAKVDVHALLRCCVKLYEMEVL